MADIPLHFVSWKYVPERNRVVAFFVDAPADTDTNPADHVPTMNFYIEFTPSTIEQDGVPQSGA